MSAGLLVLYYYLILRSRRPSHTQLPKRDLDAAQAYKMTLKAILY